MDMRFEIWDIRNKYKLGLHKRLLRESVKYRLELVRVQESRWDKGGSGQVDNNVEKEVKIINYRQDFWYTKEQYETLESSFLVSVGRRMSYIQP
jgi:hypothetical protein